jgi:xylulokinase
LVAGVDCSTQATKVLVVDAADGAVVSEGYSPHEVRGEGGARETDPRTWWEALRAALAQTGLAGQVEALSIAGQQHGLVVLGADREPLRPAILWNDVRAAGDADLLVKEVGAAEWARRIDASGTGWWSVTHERYDETILRLPRAELPLDLLPRVLGPTEIAGTAQPGPAAELGLRAGTPVGPGTGDNMGAALALGARPGAAVMSLGTSGTVYCVADAPTSDETGVVAGFADATGQFLPLACTLNATLVVDRVASWLGIERDATEQGGEVVVLPFLDGERTPNLPHAAGTVTGLRHSTTPGPVLRASYEGVIATLLAALDRIEAVTRGIDRDAPVILIGGGAAGAVWRETVARLSGRRVEIPVAQELVAFGAAVQAAAVLAGEDPVDVAERWNLRAGAVIERRQQDQETLERFRLTLAAASRLNERDGDP